MLIFVFKLTIIVNSAIDFFISISIFVACTRGVQKVLQIEKKKIHKALEFDLI